jgi:crossover junction endodeoxyribonuclease RusA
MTLKFTVLGVARPKGSTRAFMRPGMKFPIVTSDNKSVKGWEESVRAAIQQHAAGVFFHGSVLVRIAFHLPKPKSAPKRWQPHLKKPDLDKLARGSLDAMKGVLWNDDSQVVELHVTKVYAVDQPQASIEVEGTPAPQDVPLPLASEEESRPCLIESLTPAADDGEHGRRTLRHRVVVGLS